MTCTFIKEIMVKYLYICIVATLLLNSLVATASDKKGGYIGVQYTSGTYEEVGIDPSFNLNSVTAKFGLFPTSTFSTFEIRLGVGIGEDEAAISGADVTLELDSMVGVYMNIYYDIDSTARLYGILGLTRGQFTATGSSPGAFSLVTDNDTSASYGAGVDIFISNNLSLNAEYMFYLTTENFDYSAFALGATYWY